jgi:mono/diheme cytochrome c family protein
MALAPRRWSAAAALVAAGFAIVVSSATAQPADDLRIRYNSGQPVVPVFEGWERLEDGTFDMVFGYLNRNHVEEVVVPVGPANNLEPEGPDLGQPAYFYPRVHHFVFRVNVPKDWGAKEIVWTITANGKTEKAYGSLAPRWEIDPLVEIQNSGGGGPDETVTTGRVPGITIEPVILPARTSSTARASERVTFTKDVAPIFQRSCQSCHRPGTTAPMSLLSYDDARPWATSIRTKVAAREMPPWHVVRNVGIEKFKDDPSLSDDEIATIVTWVDAGAPRGNPADMPPARQFADAGRWHIGKPDLVVTATAHKVPAAGADWWGVYTVPSGLTEGRYIKAVEAKPASSTTARALHHILAYAEDADPPAPLRAARPLQGPRENDSPFGNGEFLVEYSVGKGGERFPDGSGRLLKAGSKIRFELHYHPVGEEMTDTAQIAFVFYPKGYVPRHIQHTRGLGHGGELDIPGGAGDVRSDGYTRFESAGVLTGFQPHMHARGKAQCLELIYPTGGTDDAVEQIACARFEFGSVMVYNWADEVRPIYPAGTILHVINWHDNSVNKNNPDPRNWVGNGNRTIDEMSFSWVNYYNLTDNAYRQMLASRNASQQKNGIGRAGRSALLPTNVPLFTPRRPPPGMSVSVIVYRGPAAVTFDPDGFTPVKSGEVVVKAIFSQPGTYVLQAIASDGMLRTARNMTITVNQPAEAGIRD